MIISKEVSCEDTTINAVFETRSEVSQAHGQVTKGGYAFWPSAYPDPDLVLG